MSTDSPERTLILERLIDAPPAAVWRAWTDPDHLPRWWGPDGYHCETEEIDLRQGGRWRFTMVGDGQRFPNLHEFIEMVPQQRIAYRLLGFDDMRHHADVVVTFAPEQDGTRVTLRMTLIDMTRADAIKFGAEEKGYETLAKLEAAARAL